MLQGRGRLHSGTVYQDVYLSLKAAAGVLFSVGGTQVDENSTEGRALLRNFVFMAVCFSGNHGAVTSVIALSSSFDATLGSYSVGLLYGCYVLTAMLCGAYVISITSAKKALVGSLALYAVYVASYLVAVVQVKSSLTGCYLKLLLLLLWKTNPQPAPFKFALFFLRRRLRFPALGGVARGALRRVRRRRGRGPPLDGARRVLQN
jgi:hypothetical protein